MDMAVIDRQAGVLNCIKLGAVSTFIKRDGWVEIIKSTTLPLGVLETCDYDCTTKKLYDGDYLVMVTDGVLDALPDSNREETMKEIIMQRRKPHHLIHLLHLKMEPKLLTEKNIGLNVNRLFGMC